MHIRRPIVCTRQERGKPIVGSPYSLQRRNKLSPNKHKNPNLAPSRSSALTQPATRRNFDCCYLWFSFPPTMCAQPTRISGVYGELITCWFVSVDLEARRVDWRTFWVDCVYVACFYYHQHWLGCPKKLITFLIHCLYVSIVIIHDWWSTIKTVCVFLRMKVYDKSVVNWGIPMYEFLR